MSFFNELSNPAQAHSQTWLAKDGDALNLDDLGLNQHQLPVKISSAASGLTDGCPGSADRSAFNVTQGEAPTPTDVSSDSGEIVITGYRDSGTPGVFWGGPSEGGSGHEPHPTLVPGGGGSAPATDQDVVTIEINVGRELTPSEQAAIENLKATIAAIDVAIRKLPDNAILILPSGKSVTGADLKVIWAKTDFVINENEPYKNLSYRGEANVIGQDTQNVSGNDYQISFNIHDRALDGYDHREGGVNYLVAHELGHLTQWWTHNFGNEQMANDIGRAILASDGLVYLRDPGGGGYSTEAPMQFTTG